MGNAAEELDEGYRLPARSRARLHLRRSIPRRFCHAVRRTLTRLSRSSTHRTGRSRTRYPDRSAQTSNSASKKKPGSSARGNSSRAAC
jgi:hypothetical protein